MDQLRAFIRARHLSYKTEKTYTHRIKFFINHHGKKHPEHMHKAEVEDFLQYLSVQRNVSPNTQKTALNALVFLYDKFLNIQLGELKFQYATKPRQLPTVFTHEEAMKVIGELKGIDFLIASLLYGCGLRISEAIRLRVQDIEINSGYIVVRESKGEKSRRTLLPLTLKERLLEQLNFVKCQHKKDLSDGFGSVYLPYALDKKHPNASRQPGW